MRIQEMRPGLLHLKKKMEAERLKKIFQPKFEHGTILPGPVDKSSVSELAEPRWSVVSFSGLEAAGLTYAQASQMLDSLDRKGATGLCIITDQAASRIKR